MERAKIARYSLVIVWVIVMLFDCKSSWGFYPDL